MWTTLKGIDTVYSFKYEDVVQIRRAVGDGEQRVDIIFGDKSLDVVIYMTENYFKLLCRGIGIDA